jgi:hypothetical protein
MRPSRDGVPLRPPETNPPRSVFKLYVLVTSSLDEALYSLAPYTEIRVLCNKFNSGHGANSIPHMCTCAALCVASKVSNSSPKTMTLTLQ